ncbi:MAG: hypothetical protein JWR80_9490 [Bradyrhizobium sp.]|nr:hypothetical protein [Bradyrhizobium sp.]
MPQFPNALGSQYQSMLPPQFQQGYAQPGVQPQAPPANQGFEGQFPSIPGMAGVGSNLGGGANIFHPLNPGGSVQPGGGNAPPPAMLPPVSGPPISGGGFPAAGGQFHGGQAGRADYQNALSDWRGQRPDHQGYTGTPQDWHTQMQAWHDQKPGHFDPRSFMGGGQAQPQTLPAQASIAPGEFSGPSLPPTLGQMPINPSTGVQGMVASSSPYQLPTYG